MKPEQLAKESEHSQQVALFAWAALNVATYAELKWLHAIPNGGTRGDDAKARAIRGGALKAEGVRNGVADCFLPATRGCWHGLYIEMKAPKLKPKSATAKGGLSDDQIEFKTDMIAAGYGYVVCYSWLEAVAVIEQYINWGRVI